MEGVFRGREWQWADAAGADIDPAGLDRRSPAIHHVLDVTYAKRLVRKAMAAQDIPPTD